MALENKSAVIRIGDGVGTSLFIEGSNWQLFHGELFDGHNSDGEQVFGLVCLKHKELARELCFSTLFRQLEELIETKPNGEKLYRKIARGDFEETLHQAIGLDNRNCEKFEQLFWSKLAEKFDLKYPENGKFDLKLFLNVRKPVCKRKLNGNYVDQISVVVRICGAEIIPLPTTAPA